MEKFAGVMLLVVVIVVIVAIVLCAPLGVVAG